MLEDKLTLNDDKTEVLLVMQLELLNSWQRPQLKASKLARSMSNWSTTARNLGTWFDTNLIVNTDINKTCSSAFFYQYNIKRLRKYLTSDSSTALVHAFITSRVDYCNSLYYRLPDSQLHKVQRVLNSSARLVLSQPRFCPVTPHVTLVTSPLSY